MYKNFNDIPFISMIIVTIVGIWGGLMNYSKRLAIAEIKQQKLTLRKKIIHFFVDIISSAGIAIVIFIGLTGYGLNELIATAVAGIFAHQGTRAIYLIELAIAEKLNLESVKKEIQASKGNKNG